MSTIKRGFAALDPERMREIASMGGKAAAATGKTHKFSSEEARVAGKISRANASQNKEEAEKAKTKKGTRTRKGKIELATIEPIQNIIIPIVMEDES